MKKLKKSDVMLSRGLALVLLISLGFAWAGNFLIGVGMIFVPLRCELSFLFFSFYMSGSIMREWGPYACDQFTFSIIIISNGWV